MQILLKRGGGGWGSQKTHTHTVSHTEAHKIKTDERMRTTAVMSTNTSTRDPTKTVACVWNPSLSVGAKVESKNLLGGVRNRNSFTLFLAALIFNVIDCPLSG